MLSHRVNVTFTTHAHTSTLDGVSGPVWAIQQKNEVLISGHHEKVVRTSCICSVHVCVEYIEDNR